MRVRCRSPRRRRAPAEHQRLRAAALTGALLACAALGACSLIAPRAATPAAAPAAPLPLHDEAPSAQGAQIAALAAALIGTPYEFGGADAGGFDCSGLALYVYARAGIAIPRTAAAQQHEALAVPLAQLAPGDLVFFHIRARGIDHVGVYAGAGRFIHAPHGGVAVSSAELADPYFSRHLVAAGRFASVAAHAP